MTNSSNLGGTFRFPNTSIVVNRMGYGAMQLAGRDGDKLVWGPPRDVPAAIAVLREAVAAGVNHIDTSDFYGPTCDQSTHQAGAPSLSRRSRDRDQSGSAPRQRWLMAARTLAPGDYRCRARQPAQSRP